MPPQRHRFRRDSGQNRQNDPAGARKPDAGPQKNADEYKKMELSPGAEEAQRQDRRQGRRAEPQIRRNRQPGMEPPQRPQQIIVKAQCQAQRAGQNELQRLGLEGVFHQPSSLRRKPPSGAACS